MENLGPAIAVDAAGRRAAWCDGHFAGDFEVIAVAQHAAANREPVLVFGHWHQAGLDSLSGIVAALCAHSPGRTVITKAPPELMDAMFGSELGQGVLADVQG